MDGRKLMHWEMFSNLWSLQRYVRDYLHKKSADQVANDTNSIKLQDAELEIHIYRMSEEADDEIAGELSGKLRLPWCKLRRQRMRAKMRKLLRQLVPKHYPLKIWTNYGESKFTSAHRWYRADT
jgi:hypothetical protein